MPERPDPQRLADAVSAILTTLLKDRPELAEPIAVIADHLAAAARAAAPAQAHTNLPASPASIAAEAGAPAAAPEPARASSPSPPPPPPSTPTPAPAPTAYVPLKIGDEQVQIKVPGTTREIGAARQSVMHGLDDDAPSRPRADITHAGDVGGPPADLALIARRCRLKAEACEVFIQRRRAAGAPDEPAHVERIAAVIARAKAIPNCFLWMTFPQHQQPDDDALRTIARVYLNLAAAADLALLIPPDVGHPSDRRHDALGLLAEAQSALRVAIEGAWMKRPDIDQDDAFLVLNHATATERIFLDRYMRLDDRADPETHADLAARIAALHGGITAAAQQARRIKAALSRIRYHVQRIDAEPGDDHAPDLDRIESTLSELAALGVAESSRQVTTLLAPARPRLAPRAADRRLAACLAVIDRRSADDTEPPAPAPARAWSQTVLRVRGLLRDRRIVLIGGEARDDAASRLQEAFDLAELDWQTRPEHSSSAPLEAPIARADTRLVLVLVKLAGHEHIDAVTAFCARYRKPLVRLPAGYNPEQVAAQILDQASDQLAL